MPAMAKENEGKVTKMRKPDNNETSNGSGEIKNEFEEKKSIYQRVTSFEENEAVSRNPKVDLDEYRALCKEFADHVNKIGDLMTTKPEGWMKEVKERRTEVGLLTIFMKKLNRIEKIRNRNSREHVTKVRQQVDVLQLQLQNLTCEIQHLNREVDKCLQFKSKPLGVDLVPVDEFFSEAPEPISRPEVTKVDDHQLLLARLEWELQQRKELSVLCSQMEEKKKTLCSQLNRKQSDLDSLAPLIKEVLTVTKPLQEKLGFSSGSTSLKSDRESLLPHPLYFLYIQALAYKNASVDSDEMISVEINGDDELAKEAMKQRECSQSDNRSKIAADELEIEELRVSTSKNNAEELSLKRADILAKHPLTVTLKISFKDDNYLFLEFAYILKLNIMTVIPTLSLANIQLKGTETSELLKSSNILSNLFNGDYGIDSPNVSNYYQLHEVGVDCLDTKTLGFPYVWVQKIGGLDFTSASSLNGRKIEPKVETAKTSIPIVFKIIQRRIRSRIVLAKQIMALENRNVVGPPEMKSVKLSCSIKSWRISNWDEFQTHPATAHLIETEFVTKSDMFFNAVVTRGKAKLNVLVAINCDYPLVPPLFALQVEYNDLVMNSSNSAKIVDIEREVNVYWKELTENASWASTLLMHQVHRLMVNFDIFLECLDPMKFSAEKKTFLHPHRGRARRNPFKYAQVGEGVFLQR